MKFQWRILWLGMVLILWWAVSAFGETQWYIEKIFEMGRPVLDMAVSRDGRHIFVLEESGRLSIYDADGSLAETMELGPDVDGIEAALQPDQLLVRKKKDHTVRLLTLAVMRHIPTAGSPVRGDPNASVTIIEFSEFQCPYCSRLRPILEEVMEKNAGKVKIVFKHYPLKMHKFALAAAMAAEVGAKTGKFWEFYDRLFDHSKQLDMNKILDIAVDLGFDRDDFRRQMREPEILNRIKADIEAGIQAGIQGVPKLFINGRFCNKRTFSEIQRMIDAALKEASQ